MVGLLKMTRLNRDVSKRVYFLDPVQVALELFLMHPSPAKLPNVTKRMPGSSAPDVVGGLPGHSGLDLKSNNNCIEKALPTKWSTDLKMEAPGYQNEVPGTSEIDKKSIKMSSRTCLEKCIKKS